MDRKEYQRQYNLKNREKILQQRREYYAKNKEKLLDKKRSGYSPEKQRDKRLRKEYGISLDEYNEMLEKQDYKCFCCGVHQDDLKKANNQHGTKRLVVDHDHDTGAVRKLLCNRCNTVIGLVEEDENILYNLEMYLAGCILEKERAKRSSNPNPRLSDATEKDCTD